MLGDGGSYLVKGLSLGDLRQFTRRLRGGVVGVCFERRLKSAVKLFPAGGQDGLSLGGKGAVCAYPVLDQPESPTLCT